MKFKTITRLIPAEHERDGITHQVTRKVTERVPVPPRDLDSIALKCAGGLVLALTLIAVAWSTVSIGDLLGGSVGYAAAAMFDVAWAVCLLLEWMGRFDPAKRQISRKLGWILVALTMAAIFWHGIAAGSVAMAVIGALVSLVAKILWLGVFRHIDRDLSEEDQQWVAAEISSANAKLAIAGVRRLAARAEARAAAELMAAEYEQRQVQAFTGHEPVAAALSPADDAAERLLTARARVRAIASTPEDVDPADHDRARRSLDDAVSAAIAQDLPVAEIVDLDDVRRAPAPARPATTPSQVNTTTNKGVARSTGTEHRVPEQAPRSLAAGIREMRAAQIEDPETMAARLSALMARDVPVASVKRELRRQRAAESKATDGNGGTGAYL